MTCYYGINFALLYISLSARWSSSFVQETSLFPTFLRGTDSQRSKLSRIEPLRVHSNSNVPQEGSDDFSVLLDANDSFSTLAFCVTQCLAASDAKRATGFDGASTGWTSWIEQKSESVLRECLDKICLASRSSEEPFLSSHWMRWMKSAPAPLLIDLTSTFQNQITTYLSTNKSYNASLQQKSTKFSTIDAFVSRTACRIVVLPSGSELLSPFHTITGGITYGKLLFGGVKRYRLLGNASPGNAVRRAGERTAIMTNMPEDENNISPCWTQFGGPSRTYKAVDMGPAAFLELILLPEGSRIPSIDYQSDADTGLSIQNSDGNIMRMTTRHVGLNPSSIFKFVKKKDAENKRKLKIDSRIISDNNGTNPIHAKSSANTVEHDITDVVGGLRSQIETLTRRILFSEEESNVLHQMGLPLRPRGILLYGRPGTGKTTLAKEISRKLNARSIKAVAAPELLDKWVGGSERLVRDLFEESAEESELVASSNSSSLHVIIIDELDAIFRKRTASQDSGEITRNSLVNQLLAKIDGVIETPNVLVIGITNRKELIDEALLRPGRFEVQMHIPLPDEGGRREILLIHFDALWKSGRLSQPLRLSIKGRTGTKFSSLRSYFTISISPKWRGLLDSRSNFDYHSLPDLAADDVTGGFSGAEIAGLVRCAGSIALARSRRDGSGLDGVLITLADVRLALKEIKGKRF